MFDNQPVFLSNFYKYLDTPKQVIKYYTCSKYILNYLDKDDFEKWFYTPKTNEELKKSFNNYMNTNSLNLPHISKWNTCKITSMYCLFYRTFNSFNENISDWNVSNVKNMACMFQYATIFNQELKWNITNVITMNKMFYNATKFNQELNWDVSNKTNINNMFHNSSGKIKLIV